MASLIAISLVVQVALLWVGVAIMRELQCLREVVASQPRGTLALRPVTNETELGFTASYAIWGWRGSSWVLDPASVPESHEAGKCPAFNGTYEGQRVKTQCTRR